MSFRMRWSIILVAMALVFPVQEIQAVDTVDLPFAELCRGPSWSPKGRPGFDLAAASDSSGGEAASTLEIHRQIEDLRKKCSDFIKERAELTRDVLSELDRPGKRLSDYKSQYESFKQKVDSTNKKLFEIWEQTRDPRLLDPAAKLTNKLAEMKKALSDIETMDYLTRHQHDMLYHPSAGGLCQKLCDEFNSTIAGFSATFIPDQMKPQILEQIGEAKHCLDYKAEWALIQGLRDRRVERNRIIKEVLLGGMSEGGGIVNEANALLAGARKGPRETVGVGTMRPPSDHDDVEKNMYQYLGQRADMDYVFLVNTKEQFYRDLEKITKDGKKISYLIIAGHGHAADPRVKLGEEIIRPIDVDLAHWNDELKGMAERRVRDWKEKCFLQHKDNPTSDEKARMTKLSANIKIQERRIKEALQQMELFDSVSDAMADDAVILLINCSPAATEKGLNFVRNLGRIFLGNKGGKVVASTEDVGVDQVTKTFDSIFVWLRSSRKTTDTAWKNIGDMVIEGKWIEVNIPAGDLRLKGLPVSFKEPCMEAVQGASVTLECLATGWKDSGKLAYNWNRSATATAQPSFSLEVQEAGTDPLAVEVLVKDERGRQGTDTAFVSTEPLSLKIELSDPSPAKGSSVKARALLVKGKKLDGASWYWKAEGGLKISGQGKEEIDVEVGAEGLLTLQLVDIGPFGNTRSLGQATARIRPGDDASKPPGDPKSHAEAKYRWLKESVAYLEALRELDRKTFVAFKNGVASALVRQFVASNPAGYDDSTALPDCAGITDSPTRQAECFAAREAGCGQSVGDARTRMNQYGTECLSALGKPCVVVKTVEVTRRIDGKEVKVEERVTNCDIVCSRSRACDRVFMTYSGRAGYANDVQAHVNENWLRCMGDAETANGRHQKELSAKISGLPETLPYNRWQEYKGMSMWKDYLAAVEKTKQEFGLADPIPSPIVLPWSYSSPCGGGGTVADTSKLAVTLTAKPEKISYKPGDVVNVTAHVTGGKAPYAYTWTGDHAGSGQTVTRAATKPGSYALSVEVKDAAGARGQASITLKYEGVTAEIAGLTNQIIYGTSLTLRVSVPGLGAAGPTKPSPPGKVDPEEERQCTAWRACLAKAKTDPNILCIAPPDYGCWGDTPSKPDETASVRIIWQSDKTLDFQPGTSYDGKTDVLFDRMGVIKIWAVIEKKVGDKVYEEVGGTDQREVMVVPPKFKMVFNPEKGKGKIGQEVRVTVETDPKTKPDIINYEWSWPESSGRMQYEKNASVIGFVPKDPKPVKLLVAPKTVSDRVPIGGAIQDEYTAGAYTVTVTGPRAMGPPPQIWKERVGLVNAEQQIAVFQNVSMRADIAPEPEKKPLRYQWTVTPGGCTLSNDITQEITVNCSQTGSFQATVTVKDKDGADLGSGSGSISVTLSQQTLNDSAKKAKEAADRKTQTGDAKKKLEEAKAYERKGELEVAIKKADEAATLAPTLKEAVTLAAKWKAEKKRVEEQLAKTKQLIDESKFADAQRELIVAKNLHGNYLPVIDMEKFLSEKWRGYDSTVRDKLYEVRSASDRKDFKRALELADKMRKEMKLYGGNEETLRQQEDWARKWEAEKDKKRQVFKEADGKLKNDDYAGACKGFEEGFMNAQNLWNGSEPEYRDALKGREEAFVKNKRLNEIVPYIRRAAEDPGQMPVDVLQGNLKAADEAIALQPNNEQLKKYKAAIEVRLAKTTTDNQKIAQGRKYLDAARAAENSFLSQDSYVRADSGRWGESIELSMQEHVTKAIENYQASLAYIPDKNVEQRIKELQTTLEGRKKFLENVRLSKKLLVDAEVLAKDARAEQNFDASQQKFAKAIETYQQSLNLYRPSNAETIAKIIHNLDIESKTNAFKKYRADGTALEQQQPVEALIALEKAAAFHTYAIHEGEWIQFGGQLQNLRSRVQTAKNLRARGESEQQQGKIAQAVASYEASLKLVPDQALADHVKLLKTQLAKGDEKKQSADRLWQEGTALFNQGRPSDALTKFKESLGYWSDPSRQKYVSDMEARRTKAVSLREQGAKLQGQNRIPEAIAKYRESLNYWSDPALTAHIATLEGKLNQDADTAARKARAKQLRDEGYALQQRNQIQAAIGKYKESLAVWPDRQLEDHIRQLEAKIASAPASGTLSGSAAPLAGSWTANFNNYRGAFTIRPDGSATLDIGNGGETITDLRFDASSGRITFTRMLKHVGPQHKQVYTGRLVREGYAEGSFDCTASGKGFPWKIERTAKAGPTTVPATSSTQKPGSSAVETGTSRWAGAWKSDPGPDGEVVTFNLSHSGTRMTGTFLVDVPYTAASGARQKETLRGTLEGTVSGSRVTGTFREGSDRGPTGSFEFTLAASGNLFTAVVRGEDTSDTYTVRRSGSTTASGSLQNTSQTASRSVTVEITNRSRMNAHVFTEGENFGPGNRLAPGEKRKVAVAMKADGSVVFKAGRDGKVMATKTWRGDPGDSSRVPVVVFDDTNPYDKLTVTTGLR